ncbi:lysylphosphatidylglycerol synthetase-like protein (DUF2156 family) [Psychromicrobium silvestre]|uniref:Lysylphosphatidylglycerol synthetase-like protein (DUF2156 family) n=1 Tax=Psychromicrobium silvestre TaxID=1645614 RepID=A0A7Y9LW03_9MICC|nr:DUF1453 family protein [Psychromicrobium silvestre]NYE96638.1 lysylphosphatidylglycerol synthetase-like protein (DUF2156 family) [Psychromicrobium silvestre]
MSSQVVLNILLAVVILCWVLYRQLQAKPIKERNPYTIMLVLGVLGLMQIVQLANRVDISAIGYAALVIGLLTGAVFGWVRGRLTHLWRADDGTLMRQGNWITIVLWVVGIALHLGIDWLGVQLSPAEQSAGAEALGTTGILLYLAVALAAQRFATLSRIPASSQAR